MKAREKTLERMIEEIQARLLRRCGLTSISKIKGGVLHIFVGEIIHLGYIFDEITDNPDEFYIQVLQDLSKNWQRFSRPIPMLEVLEAL